MLGETTHSLKNISYCSSLVIVLDRCALADFSFSAINDLPTTSAEPSALYRNWLAALLCVAYAALLTLHVIATSCSISAMVFIAKTLIYVW